MAHYHWSELFEPHIWWRGKNYYRDGHVLNIYRSGNEIIADVKGSKLYKVSLTLDGRTNRIEYFYCDCPYGADGTPCKHLAALLCALEEEQINPAKITERTENEPSVSSVVKSLSTEQMQQLLVQLAQVDSFVREKIFLMAGSQFPDSQKQQWQLELQELSDEASDWSGFIEYDEAYEYCCSLADYLNDRIPDMLQSGFVMEAFELVCMVFQTGMEQEMDDSDGGLTMLAGHCMDDLDGILDCASLENQKDIFRRLCAEYQRNDLARMFLEDYIFNSQWNEEIVPDLLNFLDCQIEVYAENEQRSYYLNDLIVHRLSWMERAGTSAVERKQFLQKHRQLPAAREYEITKAKQAGDWRTAISLLEESKILDADKKGLVARYSEQLIEIYEKLQDFRDLRNELEYYLFAFRQDDLAYVEKMKALLSISEWEHMRSKLLDSNTMQYQKYPLLLQEGLHEQLMDRIERETDIHALEQYEKLLKKKFPQRCLHLYKSYLEQAMNNASNRKVYWGLIQTLKKLKKYPDGNNEAQAIAEQWKQKYPRRTSMFDELKKAGF